MGVIESSIGAYIGNKLIISENQRAIINNIKEYYHKPIDIKKCKEMRVVALLVILFPFLLLYPMYLMTKRKEISLELLYCT